MTAAAQGNRDIDLRLGRWQDVLADVECDALIFDAPYGERTHTGHRDSTRPSVDGAFRSDLPYAHLTEDDVAAFIEEWAPRVRGWMACLTSHDLYPSWDRHMARAGRYVFAPIPVIDEGSRVRLGGDGPSNWTVWLVVARPKSKDYATWGTLRGCYIRSPGDERSPRMGGKPLGVMRAIIRDYSRPGDLVCDPFAGGGTTLLAAAMENRRAIGAEVDPEAHAQALARWAHGYTPSMF